MTTLSFHFHGYQPGDIVRWLEPDPLKAPRVEERSSPVSLRIGGDRVAGSNWTDAVLRSYGRLETILAHVSGVASVDVEPQTLAWLCERDPDAYRRLISAWSEGSVGLVMTPPFHPILPHHHRADRETLFDIMIDFYAPLLRHNEGPVGLWLPECAYSSETAEGYLDAARGAPLHIDGLPDLTGGVHLLLDARQLAASEVSTTAWARTGLDGGLRFAVRDPGLSGDFAFGGSRGSAFAAAVRSRGADSLLVAADLESLLASPDQGKRFIEIVGAVRDAGVTVAAPAPPPRPMAADVLDYSSWSDYDEHLLHGRTSDTRWTGVRRSDGAVVSRVHKSEPVSQIWKHAFTLVTEQIEGAVRLAGPKVLKRLGLEHRSTALRRLLLAYARHVFRAHYRACGLGSSEVAFETAATSILRGKVDVEIAGFLARGYLAMLMGLRSDPRFWDNLDTRVTFQNVACLAQALVDTSEACARAGDADLAARLLRLMRAALLEFSEAYSRLGLSDLRGASGWEATEGAWFRAVESEVPRKSPIDVVRRATLYGAGDALASRLPGSTKMPRGVLAADTGHIVGEAQGQWDNQEWCEHRSG